MSTGTRLLLLDISVGFMAAMLLVLCLGAPWWVALPVCAGFFITLGLGSGWKFKYPKGEG